MADLIRVPGGYRMTGLWTQEKQDAVTLGCHLAYMASQRASGIDLTQHDTECSVCRGDIAGVEASGYTVGDDLRRLLDERRTTTATSPEKPC